MKLLALASFSLLVACGPSSQPTAAVSAPATASVARSPVTPNALRFAISFGLPGFQLISPQVTTTLASIGIVDSAGRVLAKDSFVPPPAPVIGNAVPLLQSPVRTAGGAAFYADHTGAVHRMKPDGSKAVVATFPLTSPQQLLTYAVSPNGEHLIAIIISTPPLHDPPPQALGDPIFQQGGHWTLKLQTAEVGGPTTTTFQRDLGTEYPTPTEIVGWDRTGPLATLNTRIGAQQAPLSAHLFGTLIHIAADGTHLDAIGGTGCFAVDELIDGTVACSADWTNFSVRTAAGAALWQATLPSDDYYYGLWLSPDGSAAAVQNLVITPTTVASTARQNNAGGSRLIAEGWLDASTVVAGDSMTGQLSLYSADRMVKIRDLGFSGLFEGLV